VVILTILYVFTLIRQKIVAPWAQAPGTMRLRPREDSQGHPELRWVAAGCRLQRMESPLPSPGMPCGFLTDQGSFMPLSRKPRLGRRASSPVTTITPSRIERFRTSGTNLTPTPGAGAVPSVVDNEIWRNLLTAKSNKPEEGREETP